MRLEPAGAGLATQAFERGVHLASSDSQAPLAINPQIMEMTTAQLAFETLVC